MNDEQQFLDLINAASPEMRAAILDFLQAFVRVSEQAQREART